MDPIDALVKISEINQKKNEEKKMNKIERSWRNPSYLIHHFFKRFSI
jgi:hypothetical protein